MNSIISKRKIILLIIIYVGFNLAIGGIEQAIIAGTSVVLLGAPVLYSLNSKYTIIKLFHSVVFVTLVVTLPHIFVFQRYDWHLREFIKFDYSFMSTLEILLYISTFQFLVTFFIKIGQWIVIPRNNVYSEILVENVKHTLKLKSAKSKYTLWSVLIVIFLLPIQIWMFQNSIGFTGISPMELPFKLVGLLYYGVKFVVPFLLAYIYFSSSRNWMITLFLIGYGAFSSTLSASKGAGVIIIGAVFLANIIYFSKSKIIISVVFLGISVLGANTMRNLLYVVDDGSPAALISNFTLSSFYDMLSKSEQGLIGIVIYSLVTIIGRVNSFEGPIHAMQYDPYAVLGHHPYELAISAFNRQWRAFDGDAHHLQFIGTIMPDGWFAGTNLIGEALIIRNHEYFIPFVLLAIISASWLIIMELVIKRAAFKYRWNSYITLCILLFATVQYITNRGSQDIFMLTGIFFTLAFIPRIKITSSRRPVCPVDSSR